MLKLSRSSGGVVEKESEKAFLLLESGIRFHTTQYVRETPGHPSNFTLKIRKHIRARRLEDIRQLGGDRVVVFTFGSGDGAHHLVLELYAGGNVILCDSKYTVLTLLRSHRDDAQDLIIMPNRPYPIKAMQLKRVVSPDALREVLSWRPLTDERGQTDSSGLVVKSSRDKNKRKGHGGSGYTLKEAVLKLSPWGPQLAEHCVFKAGLLPGRDLLVSPLSNDEFNLLLSSVRWTENWVDQLHLNRPHARDAERYEDPPVKGWISSRKEGIWDDVDPLQLDQYVTQGRFFVEFPSFDAALDEFFSRIEEQRAEQQKAQTERTIISRLEKIKMDQLGRVEDLRRAAEEAGRQALLVECNLELADQAIHAVNMAVASGMDWTDIARMIEDEKRAGNPIAALVHQVELEKNRAVFLLPDPDSNEARVDDNNGGENAKVVIDLGQNAFGNVALLHQVRKEREDKGCRTIEANKKALIIAESKARAQLQHVQQKAAAMSKTQGRKPFWFEKFNWFVSSENYLVVSGRDMQQNELLVKRYMKSGDIYVHADLHGSSSTIIRNNATPSSPSITQVAMIPPLTLAQAGCQCVCRSQAWEKKVVTSAWWVYPHQVSKSPPSGEYLVTGSFFIRGKKNFLPPFPLVLGFGFMFKLDESSVAAHLGERAVKSLPGKDEDQEGAVEGGPTGTTSDERGDALADELAGLDALLSAEEVVQPRTTTTVRDRSHDKVLVEKLLTTSDRYGLAVPEAPTDAAETGDDNNLAAALKAERERRKQKQGQTGAMLAKKQAQLQKKLVARKTPTIMVEPPTLKVPEQSHKQGQGQSAPSVKTTKAEWNDDEDRKLRVALLASQGQKKDRKQRKEERKERVKTRKLEKEAAEGRLVRIQTEDEVLEAARIAGLRDGTEISLGMQRRIRELGDEILREESMASEATTTLSDPKDDKKERESDEQLDDHVDDEEKEAMRQLLIEEGEEVLEDDMWDKLTTLDSLTGIPRGSDVLMYAVPVCAPYAALQGYKYRIKVTPGTQKRGKAARQAVDFLTKAMAGEMTDRERQLIKSVPDTELIAAMVGNAKLSMPGMAKIQTANKKAKKQEATRQLEQRKEEQ